MIIYTNTVTTIKYVIPKNDYNYDSDWDFLVTLLDKNSMSKYTETGAVASYTAATSTTDGEIVLNFIAQTAGVQRIDLVRGTSPDYTIFHSTFVNVIAHTDNSTVVLNLPNNA